MKTYKSKYEDLICALNGLMFGAKLLKSWGTETVGIDVICNGIESAIKESEE